MNELTDDDKKKFIKKLFETCNCPNKCNCNDIISIPRTRRKVLIMSDNFNKEELKKLDLKLAEYIDLNNGADCGFYELLKNFVIFCKEGVNDG